MHRCKAPHTRGCTTTPLSAKPARALPGRGRRGRVSRAWDQTRSAGEEWRAANQDRSPPEGLLSPEHVRFASNTTVPACLFNPDDSFKAGTRHFVAVETLHPIVAKRYKQREPIEFMASIRPDTETINQTLRMMGTYKSGERDAHKTESDTLIINAITGQGSLASESPTSIDLSLRRHRFRASRALLHPGRKPRRPQRLLPPRRQAHDEAPLCAPRVGQERRPIRLCQSQGLCRRCGW